TAGLPAQLKAWLAGRRVFARRWQVDDEWRPCRIRRADRHGCSLSTADAWVGPSEHRDLSVRCQRPGRRQWPATGYRLRRLGDVSLAAAADSSAGRDGAVVLAHPLPSHRPRARSLALSQPAAQKFDWMAKTSSS